MHFRNLAVGMSVVAVSIAIAAQAQTLVPVVGAYRLNVAKSTFGQGQPPQTQVRSFTDRGDGTFIYTNEGTNADGNPTYNSWTFKYDGLDYPTGYNAMTRTRNTVAYRVIDPYSVEVVQKANGKPNAVKNVRTISKDGKTMTYTTTGTNAQGQAANSVLVFEKQ